MLYEFAIEPEVLASWNCCRNTLNLMGFRHARAIAAYPSRKLWKKMIFEACRRAKCGDREFARIQEKIRQVDTKLVFSTRRYDHSAEPESERWVRNAVAQQGDTLTRFHAILATQNPTGSDDVVLEEDIDESHPRLAVRREWPVLRQPNEMAAHVRTLVRNSRRLLLVDPHFEPGTDRWWPVVKACLAEVLVDGRPIPGYMPPEIHALDTDEKWTFQEFAERSRKNLIAFIPAGLPRLRIVRWRILKGVPDDFHARYILTDRGGYKIDKGLDEEPGKAQPISLLDDDLWQRIWNGYQDATAVFEKDNEFFLP
jgi:hypothetical protein